MYVAIHSIAVHSFKPYRLVGMDSLYAETGSLYAEVPSLYAGRSSIYTGLIPILAGNQPIFRCIYL